MKPFAFNLTATLFVVVIALTLYDRLVFRPSQQIGVVDVAEVYRAKEAQFAQLLAKGSSESDRQKALALAANFAQRLPSALEELPRECNCLVMVKSSVVGSTHHTVDLTEHLKSKVDL
jgi:transaldolase